MKAAHLNSLKHLPAVIEALEALVMESERLRVALSRAGMQTQTPIGAPGSVVRDHGNGVAEYVAASGDQPLPPAPGQPTRFRPGGAQTSPAPLKRFQGEEDPSWKGPTLEELTS